MVNIILVSLPFPVPMRSFQPYFDYFNFSSIISNPAGSRKRAGPYGYPCRSSSCQWRSKRQRMQNQANAPARYCQRVVHWGSAGAINNARVSQIQLSVCTSLASDKESIFSFPRPFLPLRLSVGAGVCGRRADGDDAAAAAQVLRSQSAPRPRPRRRSHLPSGVISPPARIWFPGIEALAEEL